MKLFNFCDKNLFFPGNVTTELFNRPFNSNQGDDVFRDETEFGTSVID